MDCGAEVVDFLAVVGAEEEHAGQRRNADLIDFASGVERDADIDDGFIPGPDGEGVGARQTRTVEQGVYHQAVRINRALEVELREGWKLLADLGRSADRKTARR